MSWPPNAQETWVWLSLAAAFFLATSDALTKKALRQENELIIAWLRLVFALPLLLALLPAAAMTAAPDRTFWLALASALPLEIAAIVLYVKALRLSPLSLTLPFLALTPLFLIVTARLLIGERISPLGGLGIVLIVAGSYLLHLATARRGVLEPLKMIWREKGSLAMIGVAGLYSVTSVLGKIGVSHSSPLFFGAVYFLAVTAAATALVALKTGGELPAIVRRSWRAALLPGLLYGLMIACHMLALASAQVSYMIALKRSSLLIGSLYGFVFFGERDIASRLAGATCMFAGLVCILQG